MQVIFCTLQPTYGTWPRYSQAYSVPMSLPAAAAPLAVLVLAWDETTPATRVLVEPADFAAPAPDSVAVLVPTSPPSDTLTQEEFLPLEDEPALLAAPPAPGQPPQAPTRSAATQGTRPATEATAPADLYNPTEGRRPVAAGREQVAPAIAEAEEAPAATEAISPDSLPATIAPAAPPLPTAAALVKPALVWQEVRVLHFTRATLVEPTLVWEGWPAAPAAPYLGSSALAPAPPSVVALGNLAAAATYRAGAGTAASALGGLRGPEWPSTGPVPASEELPVSTQPAYLPAELPAAPDAESDAMPAPRTDEPLLTADTSATELSEAAADPAEPFTVDVSSVQAEPTPTAATGAVAPPAAESQLSAGSALATPASLDALHPADQLFDAPNLNFQIIQYARQAVPLALAEQPFGVIYAPAWPTWLAAQELRQRTGQPLVLHLAQLAAADDEFIDLAAGWVAEIQRQALHRADLILTETPALAQRLRRELALPAHRVRPVPAADAAAVAQALRGVVRG